MRLLIRGRSGSLFLRVGRIRLGSDYDSDEGKDDVGGEMVMGMQKKRWII